LPADLAASGAACSSSNPETLSAVVSKAHPAGLLLAQPPDQLGRGNVTRNTVTHGRSFCLHLLSGALYSCPSRTFYFFFLALATSTVEQLQDK
jgi:hypothetical protein